jgi:hypothetical protein
MPKDFMASSSLDELTNHNGELILLFVESLTFLKLELYFQCDKCEYSAFSLKDGNGTIAQ